jgi:serine phosphatase RsbU (regulator of sigma subunit)
VDDDTHLLAALRRQLRRKVDLQTAESGPDGLAAITREGPFSVIVTDYRMPGMDGIEFLSRARKLAPDTVRMLLTGSADLHAAIQAVNQGNIFRFLTKPCSPEDLLEALQSGVRQYRRSREEQQYNQRTRRWLNQAMEVQQGMMPNAKPCLEGLDLAGRSIYCEQTGGDYYDYFDNHEDGKRKICVVVGDVSDHGLASALLMTSARAFFRQCVSGPCSASAIVGSVNRQLTRDIKNSGRFMTLFFAEIDLEASCLRWVRAGHEPALLYDSRRGAFDSLNGQGGLPLGVFEDAVYEEYQRMIEGGEVLVIGTDGIWEACNSAGHMFGKSLLQKIVMDNAHMPSEQIIECIMGALTEFLLPLTLQDDATLVVVKVGC